MSTFAVFAVLGGGAWAVDRIGAGDIERNAVRAKHIKPKSVRGKHVRPRSLRPQHLRRESFLPAKRVIRGSAPAQLPADVDSLILRDPRTGLVVRVSQFGSPRLVNANEETPLAVVGMTSLNEGQTDHDTLFGRVSRTIAPGEATQFTLSTIAPGFVDLLVSRVDASGVSLRLSCALLLGPRINCIGLG